MIVAFLADAHGNAEGLRRCLDVVERQGAERLYFLGDAVGYLPEAGAVLDLLRSHQAQCIRGNHEAMLLGELPIPAGRDAVYRLAEARARLAASHRAWIEQWPSTMELDLDGKRLLLVHGSPADPLEGYIYPDTDSAALGTLPFDAVLMGHTHRPFRATEQHVVIVNVGSCGLPRDVGHLASCATYDTVTGAWEILRVAFDVPALLARWGNRIDPSAAACLQRPMTATVVGRVVSE